MTIERTFSIIKPNSVANNDIGAIYARFERAGFTIIASKMLNQLLTQLHIESSVRGKSYTESSA